jgi:APA family basic amino acid/polyamine antiporter
VIALPTVILAFLYGQSRIFLVMARDGFLPRALAQISKRGTPVRITIFTAAVVALIAGFFPLDQIARWPMRARWSPFMAVAASACW